MTPFVFVPLLQSPVVGPAGQCGLPVVAHAEAEVRPEDEHVPHLHPPTVGLTVRGRVRRGKHARFRTAVSIQFLFLLCVLRVATAESLSQMHTRIKVVQWCSWSVSLFTYFVSISFACTFYGGVLSAFSLIVSWTLLQYGV